jgi:anti-anti-sigma factor
VDVEKVTFLDSTALGVLIGAWRRVREHGGCIALAGAPKQIRRDEDCMITAFSR